MMEQATAAEQQLGRTRQGSDVTEQAAGTLSLAEQIKERVRRSDQERIARRAEAAAAVAAKAHERDRLAKQLAAAERELGTLVAAATHDLMTAQELAAFTGMKQSALPVKASRKTPRKRRITTAE